MNAHDDAVARLAAQLAHVEATIADLTEAADNLKAELLASLAPGDVVAVGGKPAYRVSPGRRTFNAATAAKVLPAELVEACTVPKLDQGKVRAAVTPIVWDLCCTEGKPFVAKVASR